MKKLSILLVIFLFSVSNTVLSQNNASKIVEDSSLKSRKVSSIYQFVVFDINQKPFDFSKLKGKKLMIVNTASKCGYTPQYDDLQKLYERYKDKGFVIIGFPANNFRNQEPGTNAEIAEFCKLNYGVSFPMMEKISVKGDDMHPIYQYLTQKSKNGVEDSEVAWNFQKYLINKNGILEKVVKTKVSPLDPEITQWIENY
ncbi:MAG: glutathione peroxidase [Flavobacteriaceae bacterium]|nr:glutathione peroxidase [Flavobacteriaceae bacterium]